MHRGLTPNRIAEMEGERPGDSPRHHAKWHEQIPKADFRGRVAYPKIDEEENGEAETLE
jgi:hypothetical protein